MPDNTVQIVVSVVDRASRELREITGSMRGLESSARVAAAAIAGAAVAVGKVAYDFARLGAEAERSRASLSVLLGGAREAELALYRLQDATSGEVDQIKLATQATELYVAGIAQTVPEMERVMRAAEGLGDVIGMDTAQAVETLTAALMYRTPRALRRLGIDADNVRQRMNELLHAQRGLTEEQAFTEAALLEVEAVLKRIGDREGAVYSAADAFDQLQAAWRDLKSEVGRAVFPAVVPAIKELTEWISTRPNMRRMLAEYRNEVLLTSRSYDEAVQRLRDYLRTEEMLGTRLTRSNRVMIGVETLISGYIPTLEEWQQAQQRLTQAVNMGQQISERFRATHQSLREEVAVGKDELARFSELLRGDVGRTVEQYREQLGGLREKAAELRNAIAELEARHYLTDAQRDELEELRKRYQEVTAQIAALGGEHQLAMRRIIFDMVQARLSADELTRDEFRFLTDLAQQFGLIDQQTARMAAGVDAALQQLASGGGVRAALQALNNLAEGFTGGARLRGGAGMSPRARAAALGAMRAERGELHTAWQTVRQEIEALPVATQTAVSGMRVPVEELLAQGEGVRVRFDEIRAARESALPPSIQSNITIVNERETVEALYVMESAIRDIAKTHYIRFEIQGGIPSAAPSAPQSEGQRQTGRAAPRIPGLQSGTSFWPGGLAWVGERGPELVMLPRGTQVLTERQASAALERARPQIVNNYTLNVTATRDLYSVRHEFEVMKALGGM